MILYVLGFIVPLLGYCEAGPLDINGRIVNGTDADIKDYPYMVSVRFQNEHDCGGTILDEYNVLTAAHCADSIATLYSVQYGTADMLGGNSIPVERITLNPDFNGYPPFLNDIAILHLSAPLPIGEDVQPVTLPPQNSSTPANAEATVLGWGLDKTAGGFPGILQQVNITVYTDEECESIHQVTDERYQLCAGLPEGGKGQCNGDSGGPLLVDGVEIGIVSWSVKPCAVQGYPGVFAKVSTYIDWIAENMSTPSK